MHSYYVDVPTALVQSKTNRTFDKTTTFVRNVYVPAPDEVAETRKRLEARGVNPDYATGYIQAVNQTIIRFAPVETVKGHDPTYQVEVFLKITVGQLRKYQQALDTGKPFVIHPDDVDKTSSFLEDVPVTKRVLNAFLENPADFTELIPE